MLKWIECDIKDGMFSDEFTATVCTRYGENVSVFVPRDRADLSGKVLANITICNNRVFAILPDEHQSEIEITMELINGSTKLNNEQCLLRPLDFRD